MTEINIDVQGLEQLKDALGKLSERAERYLQEAGRTAMNGVVLAQLGTPGNYPPYEAKTYRRGDVSMGSERMGTRYSDSSTVIHSRGLDTTMLVGASYASRVIGDNQESIFKMIGWRILSEVAEEQTDAITRVYQNAVDAAIQESKISQ